MQWMLTFRPGISRAPYGARGLKFSEAVMATYLLYRRAPYGLAFYRALLACMPRNISGSSFFAAGGMALYMP